MAGSARRRKPSWTDVKTRLTDLERAGLIGLVQDLYAASKDNQAFLHTRFGLDDVQALKAIRVVAEHQQCAFIERLDKVRQLGSELGYGVGDDMGDLLAEHQFDGGSR